jgi:hypothetical protein
VTTPATAKEISFINKVIVCLQNSKRRCNNAVDEGREGERVTFTEGWKRTKKG